MASNHCPQCNTELLAAAPACPQCGWSRAAPQQLRPETQAAIAAQSARHAQGAKLVSISTWLLVGGLFSMFGGCGVSLGLDAGSEPAAVGIGLGVALIVASAVVGQVGRAKQGRVI